MRPAACSLGLERDNRAIGIKVPVMALAGSITEEGFFSSAGSAPRLFCRHQATAPKADSLPVEGENGLTGGEQA